MVIPGQTIAANALTAYIKYTVTAPVSGGTTTTYEVTKDLPTVTLEQGKQYTFNFTIDLKPVVFDPTISVGSWDTTPTAIDTAI
ncbi:MAG: hypothetical protein LBF17_05885 [Mediterranea sp.]|jgi:hypothetical protein|nr:hypothetical protein [Mediterranea sp.]